MIIEQSTSAVAKCSHCGSVWPHPGICPSVKAIEYHPDGTVKRVEYRCAGDYGPVQPLDNADSRITVTIRDGTSFDISELRKLTTNIPYHTSFAGCL